MCEKEISTANGVLKCDRKGKHPGDRSKHHAMSPGGKLPTPQLYKDSAGELILRKVEPLEIEWPQEGDNSPTEIRHG